MKTRGGSPKVLSSPSTPVELETWPKKDFYLHGNTQQHFSPLGPSTFRMPSPRDSYQRHTQEKPGGPAEKTHVPGQQLPDSRLRRHAQELLSRADIELNGDRPWDVQVHDPRLLRRVFARGSLGLGEAFMDGWWDAKELDGFFERVMRAGLDYSLSNRLPAVFTTLRNGLYNVQRGARAFKIGKAHYDIGNALYQRMLDNRMVYSCGYWQDAKDLDTAQEQKLDLICRKLQLEPGMRLLDIGCGWGSLVQYAAETHDIDAVGLTVSQEQARLARSRCHGLPVEIRYQDYRDLEDETFDRVVSVGMFEHVGHKNYSDYMRIAHKALKKDGLHLLHTIGRSRSSTVADPWISRYIFPNSMLPSLTQISRAADGRFVIEDVHNIGPHYDPTLRAWCDRFEDSWQELQAADPQYDERFRRMWRYYLLSSAGAFRAGRLQVWQIVMAKDRGVAGGYTAVR